MELKWYWCLFQNTVEMEEMATLKLPATRRVKRFRPANITIIIAFCFNSKSQYKYVSNRNQRWRNEVALFCVRSILRVDKEEQSPFTPETQMPTRQSLNCSCKQSRTQSDNIFPKKRESEPYRKLFSADSLQSALVQISLRISVITWWQKRHFRFDWRSRCWSQV